MAGARKKPLPNGMYQGWYFDSNKKRVFFTGFDTRSATKEAAVEKEIQAKKVRLGVLPAPTSADKAKTMPIQEAVNLYLAWGNLHGGRGNFPWGEGHARMRKAHLAFWVKRLGLSSLADLQDIRLSVEAGLQTLKDANRTGKTMANYAEAVKAFCEWLKENGKLDANPLDGMAGFDTTPQTNKRAATKEEVFKLLDACKPHRRLLYEVAFTTGLRAGDLRALQPKHIRPNGLVIESRSTKSRKPRFQPVPTFIIDRLRQSVGEAARLYRELPNADKRKRAAPADPLLYVPSHTSRDLEKDLEAAGIPKWVDGEKLDFHALRASYCTFVIEGGANFKEAQILMGHATADQTMKTYAKVRKGQANALVETLGNNILQVGKGGGLPYSNATVQESNSKAADDGDSTKVSTHGAQHIVQSAQLTYPQECVHTPVHADYNVRASAYQDSTLQDSGVGFDSRRLHHLSENQELNSTDTQAAQKPHSPYENRPVSQPENALNANISGTISAPNANTVLADLCASGVHDSPEVQAALLALKAAIERSRGDRPE